MPWGASAACSVGVSTNVTPLALRAQRTIPPWPPLSVREWLHSIGPTSYDEQLMETSSETPEAPTASSAISFGVQSRDAVPMLALLAGVAATFSGTQPTGNVVADFVLSFAFAAGLVWLGQYAGPQALALSAALAVFFSGLTAPALVFGLVAVAAALAITVWRRFDEDSWSIGAAFVAAMAAQAALYLPNAGFNLSASVLAALLVAPLAVTGFRAMPAEQRKYATRGLLVALVLAAVGTVLTLVAALSARSQVERGIQLAEDGITAVEQGDQPQALVLLAAAQDDFDSAHDRLSGPMTWLSRWVPVAAQHSRALETAADQGAALVATASRTVTQADVDKIRGQNGQLDLGLVEAVNAELSLANRTLANARQSLRDVSSPWLLPLLSSRLESVDIELAATATDIDLANHGTAVLPNMFGANGSRRYMVLFVQPAESREYGGFVGAYGLLEADQGVFTLAESGSFDTDFGFGSASFTDPGMFPESFVSAGPNFNPQNLTATADLSTIAVALQDLAPQWREDPNFSIDGVITIDPYALAGILELTGPLQIAGREEPVTADNVVDFLLRDQYFEFDVFERDQRQDILRVLAGTAFSRLFQIEIPGPERLGQIFGPVARGNRLSMVTFDDQENAFLDRIFLSADLPQVGSAVDMVGIFGQTGTASKLDGYSSRAASYDVVFDPATGAMSSELVITESNDAPPDAGRYVLGYSDLEGPDGGELAVGDNFVALGLYTRSNLDAVEVTTPFRSADPRPALSYDRHGIFFEVPLGGTATVQAELSAQLEPGRYDVFIPAQATAGASEFTLTIRPTESWRITGPGVAPDGSWTDTFALDEAHAFSFTFERTS